MDMVVGRVIILDQPSHWGGSGCSVMTPNFHLQRISAQEPNVRRESQAAPTKTTKNLEWCPQAHTSYHAMLC